VRNLLIAGIGGLVVRGTAAARLWSGDAGFTVAGNEVRVGIAPAGLWIGIGCLAMAAWMIWSSRVGKVRERERLLDTLTWRGDEQACSSVPPGDFALQLEPAVGVNAGQASSPGPRNPPASWVCRKIDDSELIFPLRIDRWSGQISMAGRSSTPNRETAR